MGIKKKSVFKEKPLFYFALALLIISLIVFLVNLSKIIKITGKATGAGTANLTVESITQVNFTTANINWGSGSVTSGQAIAVLNTSGGANNVTNGNWTGNAAGLIFENIGNQNVSLNIKTGKTASTLLGGTNPDYEYNVSNSEVSSCLNATGGTAGLNLSTFYDVNTTDPGTKVCGIFQYNDSADRVRIDIRLVIPSDSKTGAIGDIITATATAV